MVARKRIFDRIKKVEGGILDRLRPWAYPAHGINLPPVLLFASPKSGSIFIQRALRRTLQVEVRHIGGSGPTGSWLSYPDLCRFAEGNAVSREHVQPRPEIAAVLSSFNIRRAVVHVRDPRAAILSWTHQMDRHLPERGLRYVAFSCEQDVPEQYLRWGFEERLHWQVEHFMPRVVAWIEGWVDIADSSESIDFLITDYAELARDSRAYIEKLLGFFEIPYEEEWLKIPRREIGFNNIFSAPLDQLPPTETSPCSADRPASSAEFSALANAAIPHRLIERFGWTPAV